MKIILAVNTLGSFISHRRGLFLKLAETHDVRVILPIAEDPIAAATYVPAANLLKIPFSRKGTNPFTELGSVLAYYNHYRAQSPDLVHHFTIKPVIYGTLAARLAGVPKIVNSITGLGFVFTSKTLKARILGFLVKNLYRFCFAGRNVRVIFQNQDDRDFFIRSRILKSEQCYLVEGSGVDVTKFTPSLHANTVPVIFVASRLLIEKGIAEFMEALSLLRSKKVAFRAMIAGDTDPANPGSFSQDQVSLWKDQNLAEFLGFRTDMKALLSQTDIACLPSYREGLPMSLLEAMAAGKPIVTTDAPGCRATVRNGENGILVPPKTVEPLAAALEKLILDPGLRLRMGQSSRKIAEDLFSTERITAEIAKVYLA